MNGTEEVNLELKMILKCLPSLISLAPPVPLSDHTGRLAEITRCSTGLSSARIFRSTDTISLTAIESDSGASPSDSNIEKLGMAFAEG
jgi:hypothetical protein